MSRPCTLENLAAYMSPEQRERTARDPRCSPLAAAILRGTGSPARPAARRVRRCAAECSARREGNTIYLLAKRLELAVTPNAHHHRQVAARLRAHERATITLGLALVILPPGPWRVVIVRVSPGTRPMDDDNLTASAKGTRDAVAAWLGVDDGRADMIRFEVHQERARGYAVRVEIHGGAW